MTMGLSVMSSPVDRWNGISGLTIGLLCICMTYQFAIITLKPVSYYVDHGQVSILHVFKTLEHKKDPTKSF